MTNATIYYIHDPMCSWCWGFNQTWKTLQQQLPANISVHYLLGGLAPDSNTPMPNDMQINIRDTWRSIQTTIPNTAFNFEFWSRCTPRRSTYPACRAVIAARYQKKELDMILAIQQAYYLNAKNPSDDETLIMLAKTLHLNVKRFTLDLNTEKTNNVLAEEIKRSRSMGVNSFPALILTSNDTIKPIEIDYNHPENILKQLCSLTSR